MSKEIQPASDCIFMNSGDYSTCISFSDSISAREEVIPFYYSLDPNRSAILSGSAFSNFENQITIKADSKSSKPKINQVIKSSLQAGLMFADVAQNELNTSIISFRP